jgi:hypothetical protein
MAQQLTDLWLDEISLVDEPANKHATVQVVKMAKPKPGDDANTDPNNEEQDDMDDMEKLAKGLEAAEASIASLTDKLEKAATENAGLKAELAKAKGGDDADDVLKGLSPAARDLVQKAQADAAAATSQVAKMQEQQDTGVFIAKAAGLSDALVVKADELGPILYRIEKGSTTTADREKLEAVLKAANEAVRQSKHFAEVGKSSAGVPGDGTAHAALAAAAAEIQKANPALSEAVAFTKAIQANPQVYDRYVDEQRRRAATGGYN